MIVSGDDTIREVSGISPGEKQQIMDFLQGAVYYYCNNNKNGEWISLRDIMGGYNRDDWKDTPLGILYDKHINEGKSPDEAWDMAGKEGGWLMKKTIHQDARQFETTEEEQIRKYKLVKQ